MVELNGINVLCIGDIMLDRFLYGDVERISPEAPVPVVRVRNSQSMLGGVGNVARNIASLGSSAVVIGLLGRDAAAREVEAILAASPGITDATATSSRRPTICKNRIIARQQHVVRFDEEMTTPADAEEAAALVRAATKWIDQSRAVILSDYAKGVLEKDVISEIVARAAASRVQVFVDPKGRDFTRYRGAFCITPNQRELAEATGMPIDTEAEIVAAARFVMAHAGIAAVLTTRSERGMILVGPGDEVHSVGTKAREVFDVSGAGDTVIAVVALAHASGRALPQAMHIANAAAGIVVGKLGTATVDPNELDRALGGNGERELGETVPITRNAAAGLVRLWQRRGLRVGFTNGCFDILHAGHVALLRAARGKCDRLIVGLNSDASMRRLKGIERPINTLADRAAVLAGLSSVDAVVSFEEDTPLELLTQLLPDVLMKGADYKLDEVVGADIVRAAGGEVVLLDILPGHSTTGIITRARAVLPVG